jgi:3-(3-hydroxy-phenyl)propionate hydroxylase/6-hydroxy-3-succinoylpyridine 3-monooxygenase
MDSSQVIVSGAGPVGLVTALGLAQAGVEVLVLDKASSVGTAPRAMAYRYVVLEGFERLGVLAEFLREGFRVDGLNFVDHATGEQIHHSLRPVDGLVRHPYTLHLGQDQVSLILLRLLADLPNVSVRFDSEVLAVTRNDAAGVRVLVRTPERERELDAAWLVGADGANSAVRKSLGVEFAGFTWTDRFVAMNIRHDFVARGLTEANFQIDRVFGAIIAKINRDGLWRYAYREPGEWSEEALPDLIRDHLARALPDAGEVDVVTYSPYRVHQRAAERFRVGRVLLAGDAAHVTNPTGGLGLVGGFLDAFVLAEALGAVAGGGADESVLDGYAAERRRVFLDLVSPMATRNLRRLFQPPEGAERARMLDALRHLARDAEASREDILGLRAIVTPSLVRHG